MPIDEKVHYITQFSFTASRNVYMAFAIRTDCNEGVRFYIEVLLKGLVKKKWTVTYRFITSEKR